MLVSSVLIASFALQFVAVYFALRLIKISGKSLAWSFIAAAITLMALRRGISLGDTFTAGANTHTDLSAELIALLISALMALGIERITPIVASLRTAADRLRESEARYRLIFENSPISIWEEDFSAVKAFFDRLRREGVTDIEAYFRKHPEALQQCVALVKIVDVNQAALALHHASGKDELLAGLVNTFTPESLVAFQKEIACIWRGEMSMRHDAVVKTLDGELRHVTVDYIVCPGYEESLGEVFVSLTDITDHKQIEQALIDAELRMTRFIANLPAFFFTFHKAANGKLCFPYASPGIKTLYGLDPEDVREDMTPLHMLAHPDDRPYIEASLNEAFRTREPFHIEYRVCRPGMPERWLECRSVAVPDSEGSPLWHGIVLDITERKHVAAARAASERQFRSLAENSPDNIVRYDKHCRAIYFNPRVAQTLAVDTQKVLGKTPVELGFGGPEASAEYERHVLRVLESGESNDLELVVPHPDGSLRNHLVRFSAEHDEQGEITGVLAIGRDITKLKQAEREHQLHTDFLANMDRINRAIQGTADLETMMGSVLDEVLDILSCDRASLIYPCDPEAATWRVPMERFRPGCAGIFASGIAMPMTPELAAMHRVSLQSGHPVAVGAGTDFPIPAKIQEYGDKTGLGMALHPKTGKPWAFVVIQCSHERLWSKAEQHLFEEIGRRLADGLSSLLVLRDLRESEAKYRRMFDTAIEGIWGQDENYVTIFVNAHMADMLGYATGELQGRPVTDFMFEEDLADHRQKVNHRQNNLSEVYERRFRRKNGETLWTLISATPIFDNAGKFSGSFAMITDITPRKEAEQALQLRERFSQSLLRLSRALESARSYGEVLAIVQQEVQTTVGYPTVWVYLFSEDRQYAYPLAAEGSTSKTIMTDENTVRLFIPGDPMLEEIAAANGIVVVEDARTDPRTNKDIVAHVGNRTIINVPIVFLDKHLGSFGTGTYGDEGVRVPTDAESDYLSALASHLAVTLDRIRLLAEQQQAEEELRNHKEHLEETVEQRTEELRLARDEAEAANRAKSVFLANMSHELRTPLNAILGFSEIMRREPNLNAVQRDNLEIINHSGEHLLKLINDVLEIAKIEAGKLQLEIASFDLHGLIRDVTDMMQLRAAQKGLQMLLDQSSEFPRYIKGDEARLRQILINLVGNAIKFTDHGGATIRLGVRGNARRHLRIEVEDTGPGISKAEQKHLFKPFVQLTEGAEHGGTGLGLSIVRQFVELMNGTVAVESTPGKGSLFRVELPLETAEATEIVRLGDTGHGEVTGLAPGQPVYRILIAEDQRDNQLLLTKLMRDIGFDTRIAANGEECVALFETWRPALIWMDWRMPVMDGVEAARRIRHLPGGQEVKIVAVTASAFKEQQPELLASGIDDYVRKPYRFSEIYDALARQLGVTYTYRADATGGTPVPAQLSPRQLETIAPELRDELRTAVESLDREHIATVVDHITAVDANLGRTLSHLADEFDYPSILDALDGVTDGHHHN